MRKGFAIVSGVAAVVAVGCSHGVSRIRAHALPSPNPTSYSFVLPVEEVHAKALEAFSSRHQMKDPIFKRPADTEYWESILSAESATNTILHETLFADPANAHDIYLYSAQRPVAISATHRGRYGGLPLIADFHLHVTSKGPETVVNVRVSQTQLVNGMKFGIGSCGPGRHWNCVTVKPTTVEEYVVLRYLGRYLGVTNMPEVILPAE